MPSPFSMFYNDTVTVVTASGVTGLGVTLKGEEIQAVGQLQWKRNVYRTSNGDSVDYQGTFRFDPDETPIQEGATIQANGKSYRVVGINGIGGIPGVPKEQVAILKWLL